MSDQVIEALAARVAAIEERNLRVETAKEWERSWCRRVSIVLLTYLVMSVTFYTLGSRTFYVDAVVPTIGFFLSTLSLPLIQNVWLKYNNPQMR